MSMYICIYIYTYIYIYIYVCIYISTHMYRSASCSPFRARDPNPPVCPPPPLSPIPHPYSANGVANVILTPDTEQEICRLQGYFAHKKTPTLLGPP